MAGVATADGRQLVTLRRESQIVWCDLTSGAPQEGLPNPSVANLDNIHVVPEVLLRTLIGSLAPHRQREIKRALGYALDCPELKVL